MHPPPAFVAAGDELFYFPLDEVDGVRSLGFRAATIREHLEDQQQRAGRGSEERIQRLLHKLEADERRPEVLQLYQRLVAKLGSGARLHDAAKAETLTPGPSNDATTTVLGIATLIAGALLVFFAVGALRHLLSRWWFKRTAPDAARAALRDLEAWEAELRREARFRRRLRRSA